MRLLSWFCELCADLCANFRFWRFTRGQRKIEPPGRKP